MVRFQQRLEKGKQVTKWIAGGKSLYTRRQSGVFKE